ncbi:major facilitator superfamily domain-containing protein [Dactylonectria macrodidyma]|uniref:Major facilitator superfamily domain-containing protein n=1 Tax=Dactylonectria macrodidyma TaxID=307937 RepID=A0A9P9DKL1_9HYPO|nr:major facilitator superfamily domain-containing protein [Dactylonectria macrodidyma]
MPAWSWIVTLLGIFLGGPIIRQVMSGLDMTIAADVQASVYETLGDVENLAWVGGRAYGLFDVKALMLSSIAIFEVGSALCGAAPTSDALIIGRVIAGIGGSGMYLGALTYISILSTQKEIPLYNALIGLSWGVGAILGPVIGGAFSVSAATWRWLREIDWISAVLNGEVFVLFMIVVTFGGSTFPWKSGSAIALWVQYLSILTMPDRRIFSLHFSAAGATAANGIALYYISLFFQFTRRDTALQAAVCLLPLAIVFVLSTMVAGASLPLTGRYSIFYIVGGALVIAGGALMFTVDTAYAVAASKVQERDRANAIGFINVAQIGTVAISLTIAGSLFQNLGFNSLKSAFAGYGFPDDYIRSALSGTVSPIFSSADPVVVALALDTAGGAVLFVGSLFMPWEKLDLESVAA